MFLLEQIGSDTTLISVFLGLVSIIGIVIKFLVSSAKEREQYERKRYDKES